MYQAAIVNVVYSTTDLVEDLQNLQKDTSSQVSTLPPQYHLLSWHLIIRRDNETHIHVTIVHSKRILFFGLYQQ